MRDRRRNTLVLMIVAGLIAASAAVIALKPTLLGLDLKGGVSLVYKAQPTAQSKVTPESMSRTIEIMRKRVDQLGVSQPEILRAGSNEINVNLPDVSNAKRAEEEVGKTAQMHFYDWETNVIGPSGKIAGASEPGVTGGANPASAATGISEYEAVERAAKQPVKTTKNSTTWAPGCTPQLNAATTGKEAGCIYGQWYLLDPGAKSVVAGPTTTEAELEAKTHEAKLHTTLKPTLVPPGTVVVRSRPEENREGKVIKAEPNRFYVLRDDPVLSGSDITNPREESENGGSGQPAVVFGFNGSGGTTFEKVTKEIAKRGEEAALPGVSHESALQHFAIVLDEQVITAPSVDYKLYPEGIDPTNGSQISGGFTYTSASNLANELQSGALPIKLTLISSSQVSATLGKTALSQGLKAGLIGFVVVCLFLLLFYRMLGVIAIGGLLIYGIYFFALIKLIPIVLTLPGIAGLILTIGVAADANIVIFERVKEEIRSGRSVVAGIAAGYKRGFAAIVDANVVTFMTAFILFALATAEVQGFAFMLGIGTLTSLFTAVLATQAALTSMSHSRLITHPSALGAGGKKRDWKFDFMGASRWFFSLSGVILLTGAIAIGAKGINFGFDFTGGSRMEVALVKHPSPQQVASTLEAAKFHGVQVQAVKEKGVVGGRGYQISVKELHPKQLQQVKTLLEADYGIKPNGFSSTSIGPSFGQEIANAAVIAIIASLLVISAYIALRFEWKYAVPVLIALMHDLLITSGVYALTGREVTSATVAALLTILGYSLYDTIIVFDRIRENVPRMPRAAFSQIVNRSMSEVLTRSLATSFCTLLPVISLMAFGGATLKDFAFALIVGIASGAYSSIFIASPVLTHWKEREPVYRNRRARLVREFGAVPAYATAAGGANTEVEPAQQRRRRSRGMVSAEDPGEQLSKEEFDALVRDLDIEQEPSSGKRARAAVASRQAPPREQQNGTQRDAARGDAQGERAESEATPADPTADAVPEDVFLKDSKDSKSRQRRQRNRKHGRSR
ncbi:MAG: protein translocase subunit SecD [Solirubrobacteraceae bacterium]